MDRYMHLCAGGFLSYKINVEFVTEMSLISQELQFNIMCDLESHYDSYDENCLLSNVGCCFTVWQPIIKCDNVCR